MSKSLNLSMIDVDGETKGSIFISFSKMGGVVGLDGVFIGDSLTSSRASAVRGLGDKGGSKKLFTTIELVLVLVLVLSRLVDLCF
jgi:hypothetical protein